MYLVPLIYIAVLIKIFKLAKCNDYKTLCKELLVFAIEILDDNFAPGIMDLPYVNTLERKFIYCLVDYVWAYI